MADVFDVVDDPTSPAPEVKRDRWGRPLVVPPDGGKAVGYTRCTRFIDVLEDRFNLQQWEKRQVAIGLADRADLLLAVTAHREDKKKLNDIANEAKQAARASAAATTGTALHALTERVDRGQELPALPADAQRDLDAYAEKTKDLEPMAIERFCVYDPYKIGGTPDRALRHQDKIYIGDVKTGEIEWGAMKIGMQLAVYAHSVPYNQQTDQREEWGFDIDQDWGIVIHLPAGKGECSLHWIDLRSGWEAVKCANEVRQWRKKNDWYRRFEIAAPDAVSYEQMVASAASLEDLRAVWTLANQAGRSTPALETLCLARKEEINTGE